MPFCTWSRLLDIRLGAQQIGPGSPGEVAPFAFPAICGGTNQNEKVILRNVRSDFSSVGAIKSAKIISRCIHEEVLYTSLFGAKARVRVQSHRA